MLACSSKDEQASSRRADAAASVVAVRIDAPAELPSVDAAAPPPSADPREHLREGLALVGQQKWRAALAALEAASASSDPAALAELAFTAVLAGDGRRAEAVSQRVIDHPDVDDGKRASALYNLGRGAELRGDLAAARDAYQRSLALRSSSAVADRLARLASRRGLPVPAAPPCARPMASADLCACLATELAIDPPRCVTSHHKHGGAAWAVTVVARDQAPSFLVASPAKGRVQVLAALGPADAASDLTIARWTLDAGPAGARLVRVDAELAGRDAGGKLRSIRTDALLCVIGAAPRCLARLPVFERVGTPAQPRRLDVALDTSEARGVVQVTVIDGPPLPADLLGEHRLW